METRLPRRRLGEGGLNVGPFLWNIRQSPDRIAIVPLMVSLEQNSGPLSSPLNDVQSMRNRGALVGTHRPGSPHRATLDSHTGLAPTHDLGPTTRTRHARPKRMRFRGRTLSLRQHRVELTNRLCFAYDSIYLILRFLLGPKDRFHRDGFPCPEMNRSVFAAMIVTPFHKLFG